MSFKILQGVEIGNNGEYLQIKFNFSLRQKFRIAMRIIRKGFVNFKISGDKYEEINLS